MSAVIVDDASKALPPPASASLPAVKGPLLTCAVMTLRVAVGAVDRVRVDGVGAEVGVTEVVPLEVVAVPSMTVSSEKAKMSIQDVPLGPAVTDVGVESRRPKASGRRLNESIVMRLPHTSMQPVEATGWSRKTSPTRPSWTRSQLFGAPEAWPLPVDSTSPRISDGAGLEMDEVGARVRALLVTRPSAGQLAVGDEEDLAALRDRGNSGPSGPPASTTEPGSAK